MSVATITSKGQLTLPKAIREHLDVDQGDRLEFVVEGNGEVRVRRLAGSIERLYGILKRPRLEPLTSEEMDEEIKRYLSEEDERIRRQWHAPEGAKRAAR